MAARRGFILPVVLVVIGLLALILAGFTFFVRAEVAGTQAYRDAQQARLAAESGLEELITILRESPDDRTAWWDVPDRFRHALVWSEAFEREDDPVQRMGSREEILQEVAPPVAWRYSIVAPNTDGPENTLRYGITPEASKLHLNAASETEIEALLTPLLVDLEIDNPTELIDALLDWRDEDDEPRPEGAESEDYYTLLKPGYYAKNGPFDTVEELLLVQGFTAAVLYGEDTNRNGILDPNEDDAEESFPFYDNADGRLNLGIAPFLTTWSREAQAAQQGGQTQVVEGRINVNTASRRVLAALDGMSAEAADLIVAQRAELAQSNPEALQSKEWIQTVGVDPVLYEAIKNKITTQAWQFHVEILGYGDHLKLAHRAEWILEMRGTLAQVLYHRDLTALGFAWPIDEDTFLSENF